jgi:hypothetical protein
MQNEQQQKELESLKLKATTLSNLVVEEMHRRGEKTFNEHGFVRDYIDTGFAVEIQRTNDYYYRPTGKLNVKIHTRNPTIRSNLSKKVVNYPEPKDGHSVTQICDRIEAFLKNYRNALIQQNNKGVLDRELTVRTKAGLPKGVSIGQEYGKPILKMSLNNLEDLDKILAILNSNNC